MDTPASNLKPNKAAGSPLSAAYRSFSDGLNRHMRDRLAVSPTAQERLARAFKVLTEAHCAEIRRDVMRFLSSNPGDAVEKRILRELAMWLGIPESMTLTFVFVEDEDPSIDGKLRGHVTLTVGATTYCVGFLFNLQTCTYEAIDGRRIEVPYGSTVSGLPPALAADFFRTVAVDRTPSMH